MVLQRSFFFLGRHIRLAGADAKNFVGASNDYVGFVCGGNYLTGSDGNTYEGKPNSKANCKVVNNTVDGVKH